MAITAAVHSTPRWHCLHRATRLSGLRPRSSVGSTLSLHLGTTVAVAAAATGSSSTAAAMANHTTPAGTMQDKITLTSEERALFDTLLAAAKFSGSSTVLRAAGGWVRDKLLGKESKDIDIALDNMLGKDFADKVCTAG